MSQKTSTPLSKALKFLCLGIITFISALFLRYGIFSEIISTEIANNLKLEVGTEIWDIWTDLPVPIHSSFYFFNVTNPDGIVNGEKPIVKEIGPYVYQEHRTKIILNVNEEAVKYRPRTHWFFKPEKSLGSDEDKITLVNVPLLGISKVAWDMTKQPYVLSTLNDMLVEEGERIFQTNKVKDFLFDGVPIDNYMETLSLPVPQLLSGTQKKKVPERIFNGDFGFFDDRNGTAEDVWIVNTGKTDINKLGQIISWNGQSKLNIWNSDACNLIGGTDGTLLPPYPHSTTSFYIFQPDLCRTLEMVYVKNEEFRGLDTMIYTFAPHIFGSLTEHPQNECFCKNTWEHCMKGGLLPLEKCQGGAPIFLSRPHFVGAHPDYRNGIDGLDQKNDYESYIRIEKNTGMPIGMTFRLQLNAELQPYDAMSSFTTVPNVILPLIWIEQTVVATEELLGPLKKLNAYIRGINIAYAALLFQSFLFMKIALYFHCKANNWNIRRLTSINRFNVQSNSLS